MEHAYLVTLNVRSVQDRFLTSRDLTQLMFTWLQQLYCANGEISEAGLCRSTSFVVFPISHAHLCLSWFIYLDGIHMRLTAFVRFACPFLISYLQISHPKAFILL